MNEPAEGVEPSGPLPPAFFLAALLLQFALHVWLPVAELIPSPWGFAGIPLIVAGVAIAILADRSFPRVGTTIRPFERPTTLVTEGAFRFSRNPMYASMVLVLLGVAALTGSVTPFIVVPFFIVLIIIRFLRVEEAALREAFGEEYAAYARRVRRWI